MNELSSVISIAALVLIMLFPYNGFRIDRLRQQLFTVRDELFDEARAGHISFTDPAYKATRTVLNGMIRFAHRLSISRLFLYIATKPPAPLETDRLWLAIDGAAPAGRQLCLHYIRRANALVARHLLSSPMTMVILLPLWTYMLAKAGIDLAGGLVRRLGGPFSEIDLAAYREGQATR